MSLFIEKLLALPPLQLSEAEWIDLKDLLHFSDPISAHSFEIAIEKSNHKRNIRFSKNARVVIGQYLGIIDEMHNWFKTIANIFYEQTHNAISSDSLIPLTIELLPNDPKQLQQLKSVLDTFVRFDLSNSAGFSIINLYAALHYKLEQPKTTEVFDNESKLILIAEEIRKEEKIIAFKQRLTNKLSAKLKAYDARCYHLFHETKPTLAEQDRSIKELIEEIEFDASTMPDDFESMSYLDFYITLVRDHSTRSHKLIEFSEKTKLRDEMEAANVMSIKNTLYNCYAALPHNLPFFKQQRLAITYGNDKKQRLSFEEATKFNSHRRC